MLTGFSSTGIIFVIIVIVFMILVSIQFTLNQILKELRELRKELQLEKWYSSENSYKGRKWDE